MWQCVKCGESLPDDFESCWNCGTSIAGVEDASFRKADDYRADEMEKLVGVLRNSDPEPPSDSSGSGTRGAVPGFGRILDPGAKIFLAAVCIATLGSIAFLVGLRAGFGRAGPWADVLAMFGILLLSLAGLVNLVAVSWGALFLYHARQVRWWWPLSVLATFFTVGVGCFAALL